MCSTSVGAGRVRFVDTNVLLYAASTAPEEAFKASKARALLEEDDLALSVQVLQEFYVQATRPTRRDRLTHQQATALVEAFARFPVQDTTLELVRAALASSRRFKLSYWDAAIIEAARSLGCRTVLSEELSHGARYTGVRVENPFAPTN
jgi:predicted nucleic acid-binding protein